MIPGLRPMASGKNPIGLPEEAVPEILKKAGRGSGDREYYTLTSEGQVYTYYPETDDFRYIYYGVKKPPKYTKQQFIGLIAAAEQKDRVVDVEKGLSSSGDLSCDSPLTVRGRLLTNNINRSELHCPRANLAYYGLQFNAEQTKKIKLILETIQGTSGDKVFNLICQSLQKEKINGETFNFGDLDRWIDEIMDGKQQEIFINFHDACIMATSADLNPSAQRQLKALKKESLDTIAIATRRMIYSITQKLHAIFDTNLSNLTSYYKEAQNIAEYVYKLCKQKNIGCYTKEDYHPLTSDIGSHIGQIICNGAMGLFIDRRSSQINLWTPFGSLGCYGQISFGRDCITEDLLAELKRSLNLVKVETDLCLPEMLYPPGTMELYRIGSTPQGIPLPDKLTVIKPNSFIPSTVIRKYWTTIKPTDRVGCVEDGLAPLPRFEAEHHEIMINHLRDLAEELKAEASRSENKLISTERQLLLDNLANNLPISDERMFALDLIKLGEEVLPSLWEHRSFDNSDLLKAAFIAIGEGPAIKHGYFCSGLKDKADLRLAFDRKKITTMAKEILLLALKRNDMSSVSNSLKIYDAYRIIPDYETQKAFFASDLRLVKNYLGFFLKYTKEIGSIKKLLENLIDRLAEAQEYEFLQKTFSSYLRAIGTASTDSISLLIKLVELDPARDAQFAIEALGKFGSRASVALPILHRMREQGSFWAQYYSEVAVREIAGDKTPVSLAHFMSEWDNNSSRFY